ncbi:MAG: hypothetical protein A2046_15695 [Bacteroidetes bacterium GWA2_30_7]|nr:MAG: hypothetical protein A2046_15695 [Bacteroidetes bacterium GWA2_30_7]
MKKIYFSIVFISLLAIKIFAQNLSVTENTTHIIDEKNELIVYGETIDFIKYTIKKEIKIKILSEEGIKKYSKFILPETFDPSYFSHSPKTRNYSNTFSGVDFVTFSNKISDNKGVERKAELKMTENIIKRVKEDNRFGPFKQIEYSIGNLKIGDTLTVNYSYEVRYDENFYNLNSLRIFFNNDVFKKNYSLKISYKSNLDVDLTCYNDAKPDTVIEQDNLKKWFWTKTNLSGCINEEGSRPFLSLPHIIFTLKPASLLYNLPFTFRNEYIPFYAIYSHFREKKHADILRSSIQGVNTNQTLQINSFIEGLVKNIENDSTGYLKLEKLHNEITDNFTFSNDLDYFKELDTRDERIGDYLSKRQIRDISRYNTYIALITKINLGHFTAYVSDKRIGIISDNYFTPMYDSDYLLCPILPSGKVIYLYPKSDDFGYYLDEIPFYFEGTEARLVNLSDYIKKDEPISDHFRKITTPICAFKDNIRTTNVMASVNTGDKTVSFKTKILLSGQFSTLTRGLYTHNYKDLSINTLYNKKVWEINENTKPDKFKVESVNKTFPFKTNITADYTCNNIISLNGDTLSLDLTNFFNHIISENVNADNRQLDFYTDFVCKDMYNYIIKFDKAIQLVSNSLNTDIKNTFGNYIFSCEQIDSNTIKLSSIFNITSYIIKPENINDVKSIYDAIGKSNSGSLEFKFLNN